MGQALYRKYRSRKFSDVIGQDHIIKTLQNAIKSGRISHAYLFSGSRGVGKTSVARILAHEINKFPYDDSVHLDIIEIDAASNRRIDEIRDLREKVHITPAIGKYKVYIIDEVHMLTKEAFNALLKTLEEPPSHCIFILATTEAHKLPETIISRTQHFNFKPVKDSDAARHLSTIAKKEKIEIEPEALDMLAAFGAGSFRDSINLLDQLSSLDKTITGETVREFLGVPKTESIDKLVQAISEGRQGLLIKSLDELKEQGTNSIIITREISKRLRQQLLGQPSGWIAGTLKSLLEVQASASPQEMLEIVLLEAAAANNHGDTPVNSNTPSDKPDTKSLSSKTTVQGRQSSDFETADWPEVLAAVKAAAPSLYTGLRLAQPKLEGSMLTLAFQFELHRKKVTQVKNIELIGGIIKDTTGINPEIICTVEKLPAEDKPAQPKAEDSQAPVQTISDIFGQVEVLES